MVVNPAVRWPERTKRVLDVALAAGLLVLTCPVTALAATAIRLETPGPVLFCQERVGRNGRRFQIYKLRTMAVDNDDSEHRAYVAALMQGQADRRGGVFKLVADRRVTRVGRLLRRLSIDELPQLLNVLRGDMSMVGPRPPLPSEAELYDTRARQRLAVKPGITGLWQVSGRCLLSYQEMIALDLQYCRSSSVATDLGILLRTPASVLSRRGAA